MAPSADLVTQVRSDLAALLAARESTNGAMLSVWTAKDQGARERAAFEAVRSNLALRSLGEIASLRGVDRDDLLRLGSDDGEARKLLSAWVTVTSLPKVFRAFARVLPYSFRPFVSEGLRAHQELLRQAIREPVWPGISATLEQLFVPQRCDNAPFEPDATGARVKASRPHVSHPTGDVLKQIEALLHGAEGPVVVMGGPGAGKSSLAAMIAGEYAARWGFTPILFRAATLARNDVGLPDASSSGAVAPLQWLDDLAASGQPLVLVDGLDELPATQLSRALRPLRATFDRLGEDSRLVLFGRPSAGLAAVNLLPASAQAVTLLPFDAAQSREWAARWQHATGRRFDVEAFLAASVDHQPDVATRDVVDLARAPLTLFLLASIELAGKPLPTPKTARGRAAIFRRVLDRVAPNQATRAEVSEREAARAVAVALRLSSQGDVRRGPITARAAALLGSGDARQRVDDVVGRFPITVDADNTVRFVHAAMRDQLVAEFLAERLSWLLDARGKAPRRDDPRERSLVAGWIDAFGLVPIDEGLLAPLRHMVPDWRAYQNESARKTARDKQLRALLPVVYRWLVDDRAAEVVLGAARARGERPRRVAAIALFNVFAVASCALRGEDDPAWFEPEQVMPGSFATAWHIVAAEIDLPGRARDLVTRTTSLRGMQGASLDRLLTSSFPIHGADLSGADLRGLTFQNALLTDVNLDRASLEGARFHNVRLWGASLVGADARAAAFGFVEFNNANLREAKLQGASFSSCSLVLADLRGADLTGASFLRVDLRGANLDGATYDPRLLEHARVGAAPGDDIPF